MMAAPAIQGRDTEKAELGIKSEKLLIFGTAERELLEKQVQPARLQTLIQRLTSAPALFFSSSPTACSSPKRQRYLKTKKRV